MYKKKSPAPESTPAGTKGDATRKRLVETTRELANERGLEAIGARELARALGLSPGNVSYHFARKEDLVRAAMTELREENARALAAAPDDDTIGAFLERFRVTMQNQLRWRCVPRAIVYVVETFPELGAEYRGTEQARRAALGGTLDRLRESGELDATFDAPARARVIATCSLVARFWLSEQRLSYHDVPEADVIEHYLSLVAQALLPHATARGKRALLPALSGVRDVASRKGARR